MSDQEVLDKPASITEFNAVEKGLAELRTELKGVQFDVTTTAGDKAARAARSKCVSIRTSADAAYEGWNKPMIARQREMRGILAKIKDEVKAVEEPIDAQIKAEEARKAEIKAAKEVADLARQQAIQTRINAISQYPAHAAGKSAAEIAELRIAVSELPITPELYEHRAGEAMALQSDTINKLTQMHMAAKAQQEESVRLASERAELERQRLEQEAAAEAARQAEAQRVAAERAKLAADQAALKAAQDAENARQEAARAEQARKDAAAAAALRKQQEESAAALQAQQDEIDRQRRALEEEQAAVRKAEQDRLDAIARAEREKAEAEARAVREKEAAERAAAEAAERERQAEAARREQEHFEENGPGDSEILKVLANLYGVSQDTVLAWILKFDIQTIPA